jgi:hypothetical protein
MKLKPRVEMKRLAVYNLVIAGILLVGEPIIISPYMKLRHLHWDQLFRTEAISHGIMAALGAFIFALIPLTAFLLIRNAWIIFKNLRKISDD